MKNIYSVFFFCFSLLSLSAQQADYNLTVRLSAEVSKSENSITLKWPVEDVIDYKIYRKDPGISNWGSLVATVTEAQGSFVDTNVEPGKMYEYLVLKTHTNGSGFGYIYSGIEVEPTHFRGRLLLLVDDRFIASLENEIQDLSNIITSDGWEVTSIDISPDSSVMYVKSRIADWYNEDPVNGQALFLLGHIPVPYSGNINPDGHANHRGAWSADTYYGDIDGNWTDVVVNNTTGASIRTHNVPGDGKFDNSVLPSNLELQVGRVDFFNLPLFDESEEELYKRYILKNIAFRTKEFVPERRALIENNFAGFAEGFGQNGLRNFPTMFGDENTSYLDYDNLLTESYMWSYGCGGGNYQGASGISNTTRLTTDSLQTVFTMLFGSYFGDWDSQNNFLRSVLASGTVLSNAWAGRPNWVFHPMAMGQNIGYCARLSQNNNFIYNPGFGARFVHTGLMGDPSLRMHVVGAPKDLAIEEDNSHAILTWTAPDENILGYYVYKSYDLGETYELITELPVTSLTYTDSCLSINSANAYLVKTAIMENSTSGTYVNLSLGERAFLVIESDNSTTSDFDIYMDGNYFSFTNLSENADAYMWDFGDGHTSNEENPVHFYEETGEFTITLIAYNECRSDSFTQSVLVTGTDDIEFYNSIKLYPNPVSGYLKIELIDSRNAKYQLVNTMGKVILKGSLEDRTNLINTAGMLPGLYNIVILQDNVSATFKIIVVE